MLAKAGGDRNDSTAASSRNDSLRTRSVSDLAARHEHRTEADPQGRRSGLYGATSNTHQPHLWTASAAVFIASGKTFTVPAVEARADFAMRDRAIVLAKRDRGVPADRLRRSQRSSCCGARRGRACARRLSLGRDRPDREWPRWMRIRQHRRHPSRHVVTGLVGTRPVATGRITCPT